MPFNFFLSIYSIIIKKKSHLLEHVLNCAVWQYVESQLCGPSLPGSWEIWHYAQDGYQSSATQYFVLYVSSVINNSNSSMMGKLWWLLTKWARDSPFSCHFSPICASFSYWYSLLLFLWYLPYCMNSTTNVRRGKEHSFMLTKKTIVCSYGLLFH